MKKPTKQQAMERRIAAFYIVFGILLLSLYYGVKGLLIYIARLKGIL